MRDMATRFSYAGCWCVADKLEQAGGGQGKGSGRGKDWVRFKVRVSAT